MLIEIEKVLKVQELTKFCLLKSSKIVNCITISSTWGLVFSLYLKALFLYSKLTSSNSWKLIFIKLPNS